MAEKASAKVLFFDIGGVLLSNGWGHVSRKKAAEKFGIDYGEMEVLHHFIFNIYEIGKITLDEYLETVVFNKPREFTPDEFKRFMLGESTELPGLLGWLKSWKRESGFRIISLNNEGKELNDYRVKAFALHECFDAFISSCEVGMRKPDPGIYRLALSIAHQVPEQCFYFDDRMMLVEAAKKHGIRAFHHEDFESTRAIVGKLTL